jgi:hypothetical protein
MRQTGYPGCIIIFLKGTLILLVYVNDCITQCPQNQPILDFIESMKMDYIILLTDGGGVSAYLIIQVDCKKTSDGLEYNLTQPALISHIIDSVYFEQPTTS